MWPGIWARSKDTGLGLRMGGEGMHSVGSTSTSPISDTPRSLGYPHLAPSLLPLRLHLSLCPAHSNDFSKLVAGEYLKFFVFTGMTLDQALRWVSSPLRAGPTL